jgi:PAS domain S-box-containing protein
MDSAYNEEMKQLEEENQLLKMKLIENENQYMKLYDNLPISVWLEDFSAVTKYLDDLEIPANVTIETYLDDNPEVVKACIKLVKIIDVNQYTLKLYDAQNKKDLLDNLQQILTDNAYDSIKKELIAVYNKISNFTMEVKQRKLNGDEMDAILNWYVPEQFSSTMEQVYITIQDITQQKLAEEETIHKVKRYQHIFEFSNAGIMISTLDKSIIEANEGAAAILGYSVKELLESESIDIYADPNDRQEFLRILKLNGQISNFEIQIKSKDKRIKWVSANVRFYQIGDEMQIISILTDIDDRKRLEKKLDSYLKCLNSVLYAVNETALMQEICDILVETTKYEMVWIGIAQNNEEKTVLPLIYSGKAEDYFKSKIVRWDDSECGMGPTGMAIKTKQTQMVSSLEVEPQIELCIDSAHLRDYKASVSIPMIIEKNYIATINIYSSDEDSFNAEELSLLEGIADNLTFGIKSIRTKQELNDTLRDLDQKVKNRTEDLQNKNQELSEFTYSVTHDLRAPLRAMQGFSNALVEDYHDVLDNMGVKMANRINNAAEKMDKMISDLLIHSKITQKDIRSTNLDLEKCVNDIIKAHEGVIKDNNIEINVDLSSRYVRGSKMILKQVINNLFSNAIKFIDENKSSKIKIWSEIRDHMIRLYMEDNGIGIEEQYFENIFKVFRRLHGEEQYPGTGIGLAIVKKGMEKMGGKYGVESIVGEFTRFWIELPMGDHV